MSERETFVRSGNRKGEGVSGGGGGGGGRDEWLAVCVCVCWLAQLRSSSSPQCKATRPLRWT